MVKIFRRIRQQLLSEGKASRYFLYAIGEIVLVVIGILIALQINNYSQLQKERNLERSLLNSLSSDVNLDVLQIEGNTRQSNERLSRLDSLIQTLGAAQEINITDFIRSSYDFVIDNYFKCNSGVFDEAVSSGKMSYIQNEKLRQNIFDYYRTAKDSYTDGTTRQITDEVITPLMVESLFLNREGFSILAMDVQHISSLNELNLESLKENKDFWKMVMLKFGGNQEQMIRWGVMKKQDRSRVRKAK
ncbi:DUF6090 family protein [Spongiivirga citrea]|uniref:Uncharacterized protein n=1 Tax=Spongiivirga citrea TaxID=1481457 RepID=A0A6M0CN15_9FLAO|nr:DUF6090 family protein [Spongiivirga citrea]NER17444.1 hypothetical protein [Spongiivirga citrea]